jgi:hypoxanthine phosphoribosyltransferase
MSEIQIDGHRIGVLFSEAEIAARVAAIAESIAARDPYNLLVVPILKGSFVFAADLIRAMHHAGLSPEVDFMILSSYRKSTKSSGQVTVLRDIETDVRGRDVLLIDDILESGRTLAFAKDLLAARGAKVHLHRRAVAQAWPLGCQYRRRFRRIHLPGQVRGGLWHGHGAPVPRIALCGPRYPS